MKSLAEQLQLAGLQVSGCCLPLSHAYGDDFLQVSQLLQDMTPAEADVLGASMLLISAEPGQALIREGDAGEWMLLVLKGTVDITKAIFPRHEGAASDAGTDAGTAANVEPGAEMFSRIAVIGRGATLGEMSMLDSEPRYASCVALEPVQAGVLGRREIGLLIRDHPGVGAKLLVKITQLMARRLRNSSNQLVKLIRSGQPQN
ncbi:MAG: Crp/Fnr family transcriptional regulator [Polaromonas sp.]|nr:Crp/Fnr family transcriptional regulator [Polaromonas sp.]